MTLPVAAGPSVLLDGTVAVVGDEIILKSELDAYTTLRLGSLAAAPEGEALAKYRKRFLDEMIDGKVLLVHAKTDSTVTVSGEEVDRALDNHILSILRQNALTIDSLESLLQREQGISLAKFKEETKIGIREQLLKQKIQRTYLSAVKVSRRDVEIFYTQYRDSLPKAGPSVLLSKLEVETTPPATVRQTAYDKILSIKQKLASGEDFAAVAKQHSESPDAADGGDLGFIEKGSTTLRTFEEKAFALGVGQISDPFETKLGFHIVKVVAQKNQQVHVLQIFVAVSPTPEQIDAVSSLLDSVRQFSTSQNDFVAAVRAFSTDNLTKIRDGKLGWKSAAELPGGIRAATDTLSAGDISAVIRDNNSFSLYRVDNRLTERTLTLEDDWQVLADKARDIMAQKKLIDLVSRWRQQIFISTRM